MKISLSGSLVLVSTLGLGMTLLAQTASAEPASAKSGKATSTKNEGAKAKTAAKDDEAKKQPEASPVSKPEASAETAPSPAPQPSDSAENHSDRKVSPFGSQPALPATPQADEPQNPAPGHAYPPPGFPPPWYGYPPPGHGYPGYPPPGYGYPPPGYPPSHYAYPPPGAPMGEGRPHCRFCRHHGCDGQMRLPPEQRPGYHAHDGFLLRLGVGGGYAQTSISINAEKLTYSGTSIPLDLAIGAAIRPNFILFGEVIAAQLYSPTSQYVGETRTAATMNVAIQGVGPGVVYYFMPINIYVSGSLLLHKVSFTDDNDDYDSTDLSTIGFAGNLMAGKEWWVSRDWGLGLAAHFMMGTAKNRALHDQTGTFVDSRWNSIAFGLLMSATYN